MTLSGPSCGTPPARHVRPQAAATSRPPARFGWNRGLAGLVAGIRPKRRTTWASGPRPRLSPRVGGLLPLPQQKAEEALRPEVCSYRRLQLLRVRHTPQGAGRARVVREGVQLPRQCG